LSTKRILIVDDEKKIVNTVSAYLEKEGFATIEAYDGEAALKLWREESPDLVVLDILMPGVNGLEFCREVRQTSNTPIIILSAKSEEADKLIGLELGADDYMTKPFSARELVARIRAVLRRSRLEAEMEERPIAEGPLVIYRERHQAEIDGRELTLTPTEFDILVILASTPGRVYSRGQIVKSIQGGFYEGYERTVDSHIKNLRRKLANEAEEWDFIETVYGVGYRFLAQRKA
jgi:DNA-binding response OmpR family regulator